MSKVLKVRILSWLGRTKINLILFLTYRTNFQEFLRRPDHKQDFVAQWQADFNSVPEDLWEDEETKAELHQRVNVRTAVTFCARVIPFSLPHLYTPTSPHFCLQGWKPQKNNDLNSDPVISNFTKDWLLFLWGSGYTHGALLRRGTVISSAGALLAPAL